MSIEVIFSKANELKFSINKDSIFFNKILLTAI